MSIKLRNVTVDYGNFVAVENLNIDIKTGEMAALLGPSGCGKSTTLNAISGLIQITSGQILFDGIDVTNKTTQKRNIGLVFQNYGLYPHLNVFQNIAFPLYQSKSFKRSLKNKNNNLKLNNLFLKISKNKSEMIKDLIKEKNNFDDYILDLKNKFVEIESEYISSSNKFLKEYVSEFYKDEKYDVFKNKLFSYLFDKMKLFFWEKYLEVFVNIKNEFTNKLILIKNENLIYKNNLYKIIKKIQYNLNFREVDKLEDKVKMFNESLKEHTRSIEREHKLAVENAKLNNTEFKFELNDEEYENKLNEFDDRSHLDKKNLEENISKFISISLGLKINSLFENTKLIFENTNYNELLSDEMIFEFKKKNKLISFKKEIRENVEEVADKVEIKDQLHKKPYELSGGQQQRVAIARSIIKKPKILLLDEPLSNLDAKLRVSTREWIKRFQKETGITTIFVTHDQEEALSISDKIFVMSKGVLQQDDEPINIYQNPKNLFVANFIGTPSMNFLETKVDKDGEILLFNEKLKLSSSLKGKNITLGFRPEHLKISNDSTDSKFLLKNFVEGTVVNFELLGKSNYIKLKLEEKEIGIVFDSQIKSNINYNEKIKFNFTKNNLYIFDTDSTELIEVI